MRKLLAASTLIAGLLLAVGCSSDDMPPDQVAPKVGNAPPEGVSLAADGPAGAPPAKAVTSEGG